MLVFLSEAASVTSCIYLYAAKTFPGVITPWPCIHWFGPKAWEEVPWPSWTCNWQKGLGGW